MILEPEYHHYHFALWLQDRVKAPVPAKQWEKLVQCFLNGRLIKVTVKDIGHGKKAVDCWVEE